MDPEFKFFHFSVPTWLISLLLQVSFHFSFPWISLHSLKIHHHSIHWLHDSCRFNYFTTYLCSLEGRNCKYFVHSCNSCPRHMVLNTNTEWTNTCAKKFTSAQFQNQCFNQQTLSNTILLRVTITGGVNHLLERWCGLVNFPVCVCARVRGCIFVCRYFWVFLLGANICSLVSQRWNCGGSQKETIFPPNYWL